MTPIKNEEYFKGRGAQINTHNKFLRTKYVADHEEGIDELMLMNITDLVQALTLKGR